MSSVRLVSITVDHVDQGMLETLLREVLTSGTSASTVVVSTPSAWRALPALGAPRRAKKAAAPAPAPTPPSPEDYKTPRGEIRAKHEDLVLRLVAAADEPLRAPEILEATKLTTSQVGIALRTLVERGMLFASQGAPRFRHYGMTQEAAQEAYAAAVKASRA